MTLTLSTPDWASSHASAARRFVSGKGGGLGGGGEGGGGEGGGEGGGGEGGGEGVLVRELRLLSKIIKELFQV